jgi:hypothetical protein
MWVMHKFGLYVDFEIREDIESSYQQVSKKASKVINMSDI